MSDETAEAVSGDAVADDQVDHGASDAIDDAVAGPDGATESDAATDESTDGVTDEAPAPAGPSLDDLPAALEAILVVVDEPVSEVLLAQVLEHPTDVVVASLRTLAEQYTADGRGFELREVAGGWRLYTREQFASWVEKFVLDGQAAKLTQAALETLAVVAYRQPVSRGRVSAVRGVNVDGVMRTLLARGLVEEVGSEHETGAVLYGTTTYFLERLGLASLDDLPELAPYLPELDTLDLDSELLDPIGSDV